MAVSTSKKAKKASSRRRTSVDLHDAPASTRGALARDIKRLLRKHGIAGELAELHVKPRKGAAGGVRAAKAPRRAMRGAAPAAAAAPVAFAPCPAGQVRRVVCFVRKGTFVCQEKCVPV